MKIRQQFKLQGSLDPFTLLKVSQAFRETPRGEALEFTYMGERMPDELFKVLPRDEYAIVEQDSLEQPRACRIVIQRRRGHAAARAGEGGEGCACG